MKVPKERVFSTDKITDKIINLTPWRIILEGPKRDGTILLDLTPATKEAALASNIINSTLKIDNSLTINILEATETVVVGLPQQTENRYFIVTPIILEALKGNREDCLTPCTLGDYGTFKEIDGVFTAKTIAFLRGSFSQ